MSALSRNCAHHVEKQSHALIEVKNKSTPLLNCMQISHDRHAKNQTKVMLAKKSRHTFNVILYVVTKLVISQIPTKKV